MTPKNSKKLITVDAHEKNNTTKNLGLSFPMVGALSCFSWPLLSRVGERERKIAVWRASYIVRFHVVKVATFDKFQFHFEVPS